MANKAHYQTIEYGMVGFDAYGKLQSVAWIDAERGLPESVARRDCRRGGLAVRKVTADELRQLMIEHGWVNA